MESLINCARFKPCFFSTISNSAASFTFIKRVRGAPAHARGDVHARYMHARARARTCANLSFGRTDGRSVRREQRTRFFTFFSSLTACFPRLKGVEPPPKDNLQKTPLSRRSPGVPSFFVPERSFLSRRRSRSTFRSHPERPRHDA